MKTVHQSQSVFMLSGFMYLNIGSQGKWSHETGFWPELLTQGFPFCVDISCCKCPSGLFQSCALDIGFFLNPFQSCLVI